MSINRAEMKTLWTVVIALACFGLFQWADIWVSGLLEPLSGPSTPILLESFAFACCFAIFTLGWMVFVPTLCRRRLTMAALFAGVGLLDLFHGLSREGMPFFQESVGETLSAMFGWYSQFAGALGLLIVFSFRNRPVRPRTRLLAIVPVVACVGLAVLLVFWTDRWDTAALDAIAPYQAGTVLALYAAGAYVILFKYRVERPQSMLTIVQALILLFFAKLEETFGTQLGGTQELLAGLFKLAGYFYLLRGVYYVLIDEPFKRQKKTAARINHLAFHDELTGLPNRRLFADRIIAQIAQASRGSTKFAVLWLDVDRFKTINDSMGHSFGDRLLVAVSERLSRFTEKPERAFRLGGDEFTVLLGTVTDVKEAEDAAQRLVAAFEAPVKVDASSFHLTVSVGLAIYPDDGHSFDMLLQNADTAMYGAKESRNAWKRYALQMNLKAKEKLLLENDLRIALELGQFYLAYQPLVDLERGELVGAEALVRWNHPQRGTIPPAEFIPLCEENGFILPLGEWVLRNACEQSRRWQTEGHPPIVVAVNLSIRQFRQSDLCERIAKVLEETGLESRWLELEITESIMADVAFATEMLGKLKRLGVRISIDDFGTGYSSLYYLKRFPIDKLKIDRSFVNDVLTDRNDAAIVSGISAMARTLNLKVTAEGVENEGQVAFLKEQKCQEAQGYFFSRPVSPEKFAELFDTCKSELLAGESSA